MADIFDQAAAKSGANTPVPAAAPAAPDIFDRIAAPQKPSGILPRPEDADAQTTAAARAIAERVTRLGPRSIPGMERLGGAAPGPPRPQLPSELQSDAQQAAGAPTWTNPRSGATYRYMPPGKGTAPENFLDMPITGGARAVRGAERMAEPGMENKAAGASEMMRGAMEAATPLAAGGVAAPVETGLTLAAGTAAQWAVEKSLTAAGVPKPYAALFGDLSGIFGGGAAYVKLRALAKAPLVAEGNAIELKLRQAIARAKDGMLPGAVRDAAKAQIDGLIDGLRKTEAGRASAATSAAAAVVAERPNLAPGVTHTPGEHEQQYTITGQPVRREVGDVFDRAAAQRQESKPNGEQPNAVGSTSEPQEESAAEGGEAAAAADERKPAAGAQSSAGAAGEPGEPHAAGTKGTAAVGAAGPGGSKFTLSPLEQRALRKGIPPWIERAESVPGAGADLADPRARARIATAAADDVAAGRLDEADVERALVGRYGETARPHAAEIWRQAQKEAQRGIGPEGPIAREFRHNEGGATDWVLARGSGEAVGALHDPVLGDVDLVHGLSSETAKPQTGAQGLDHIRTDHPDALGHLQEILDTATTRIPQGNKVFIHNDRMGVGIGVERSGQKKNWVVTGFKLDKTPASGTSVDAATGPKGRGGSALPPAGVPSVPLPSGSDAPDTSVPPSAERVKPTGSQYAGSGLGGLEPFFRESIAEMAAAAAKRKAALAEVKAAQATPGEKKFGTKVIEYFTGERDMWGARVNQAIARLRKLVPDHVDQEALSLMRDFKGKEPELTQFLQGAHPALGQLKGAEYKTAMERIRQMRPAILRALNPTRAMRSADRTLTSMAGATLREGQRLGFLDSRWTPEQYNPHILHPKGEGETPLPAGDRLGRMLGGKMGRRFAFAERREFPTLLDAVANNYKPKTLNAFDAFTIHGDKFATARATHLLTNLLNEEGAGKWGVKEKAPEGWVPLAAHSTEFRNLVPYLREGPPAGSQAAADAVAARKIEGLKAGKTMAQVDAEESLRDAAAPGEATVEPDVAEQRLFVPQFISDALRPITDPDYMGRIPLFRTLRQTQAYQKAVQLGLSFFHATTENYMALANMGPRGWMRALGADRDSLEFLASERDMIAHGGTSAIQGRTYEAYHALEPGSIPSWGDIWTKAPVVSQMDWIAGKITEFTFGNMQRRFKVTDYQMHVAKLLAGELKDAAAYPNSTATAERLAAGKQSIAKEVNAVYGGLHWENLSVNRATTEIVRALAGA